MKFLKRLFMKDNVKNITDTVKKTASKFIKNSATGDKQDARRFNRNGGWLDQNIHELVILIILLCVIFGKAIGIPEETNTKLIEYLGLIIAFLFGRPRR
ncbi:hypothetical protein K4L44_05795 [Halosquirtibacter laminarini]|uniref:Uncharacterized protein n=1 Tax=Halosquirtibacter laminarini TaxID=3374600 RepID=A0AC61NI12_9BACT|nr:hypothetical protein K4L44_05795 [Prolixibacteraceae bacterium]